jgi:hypothetical protein
MALIAGCFISMNNARGNGSDVRCLDCSSSGIGDFCGDIDCGSGKTSYFRSAPYINGPIWRERSD